MTLHFPLQKFVVSGRSMEPTLKEGMTILVSNIPYLFHNPRLNDIVALIHPDHDQILIKRIIKITSSGYFVEGDNKAQSTDSRSFGEIKRSHIKGKLVAVV